LVSWKSLFTAFPTWGDLVIRIDDGLSDAVADTAKTAVIIRPHGIEPGDLRGPWLIRSPTDRHRN
jgi:hypothetical protein